MLPLLYEKKKKKRMITKLIKTAVVLSLPFLAYKGIQKLAKKYDEDHPETAEAEAPVDEGNEEETPPSHFPAAICYTKDTTIDARNYTATAAEETAILIKDGASVTINHAAVTASAEDDDLDPKKACRFGVGAALLAVNCNAVIRHTQITTDKTGGTGIFADLDGVVRASDTGITTTGAYSDGLRAVRNGMIYVRDVTVKTSGKHSAALSSIGNGSILVADGTSFETEGMSSPVIRCEAETVVHKASLSAARSEAASIRGCHALHLFDSSLTSGMTSDKTHEVTCAVSITDAKPTDNSSDHALFHMTNGSLTAKVGGLIHAKEAHASIYLNQVKLVHPAESEFLLKTEDAEVKLTAEQQMLEGTICVDHQTHLDLYLKGKSAFRGAILVTNRHRLDRRSGKVNVYLDSDSEWIVTEDSVISNLYSCGTIKDEEGRTVRILDQNGTTLVKGTSHYKITLDHYETTADFSGAEDGAAFSDFSF